MTDFIRRLVDRGLGAVHAGTPMAKPAQTAVGVDAKLDKNVPRPSTPEMLDETESSEADQRIHGPAVASRGSPRPTASPVLATPLVDLSPPALRSQQLATMVRNSKSEPRSTGKESPVASANQIHTRRRTPEPASRLGGATDASIPTVAFRQAAASPGAIHPESTRADSRPNVARDSVAISAAPLDHKGSLLPDTGKTPQPNRHGSRMVRGAPTDERSDHDHPVNLILPERPAPSPRPTGSRREGGDAAVLRPAPTASRPAAVLEAPRSRVNTAKDSPVQPLSPRAQRPADLAPIVAGGRVPAAERSVSVRIGTIEVRSEAPAPVAPPTPPTAPPAPGFEEYAALRSYARRSAR